MQKAKTGENRYHKIGTEIYMLIEGSLYIEVEDVEYSLDKPGDIIIVHPFSVHEVINKGNEYICRVVTLNCRGDKDKFLFPINWRPNWYIRKDNS